MSEVFVHSAPLMGTVVSISIVGHDRSTAEPAALRAMQWFREVESRCTRFDPASELRQLCRRPGLSVAASPMLFEVVRFALVLADETGGAFDPTVGARLETPSATGDGATFRDVTFDSANLTISLNGRCCSILARSPRDSPWISPRASSRR